MVPPRAVKYPTSRRNDLNSGVAGAGDVAGRVPLAPVEGADFSAADARASKPTAENSEERNRKARRFMGC
jgi:hypothetical protein